MNVTSPPAPRDCRKVSDVFSRIGDRWSMQVILVLNNQKQRFNEIKKGVNGISQQMLARTLKLLERDGLIERFVLDASPPKVSYELTTLGLSLAEQVMALASWSLLNFETLSQNRERYDKTHEN
ncbi:transcriptional regulator [Pseudomonas orientalis]|uniref:Transcriptional regulator n=2 Tax=Pseudomonas orientalis TaxID=76758 RepID=A0A4Q7D4B2_9PSED|nr:helix-turn-helix domain-containing protein [Pseudomonas orientalis]RZI32657.1 transcriptional regulator [Pseudomonas orientalis]